MPKVKPITLPLLPLTGAVVLPGMVLTMALESSEARQAYDAARNVDGRVVLVPRLDHGFAAVGTIAGIEELAVLPNGSKAVAVKAQSRALVGRGVAAPETAGTGAATWVEVDEVSPDADQPGVAVTELAQEYRAVVESILESRGAHPLTQALRAVTDPSALADTAGFLPELTLEQRVELLETVEVEPRLRLALGWARDILGELTLKARIRTDVAEGMEKAQRDFLLRQQMAAIRRELGEEEDGGTLEAYRRRLGEAALPQGARTARERELGRLERMSEASPEHGWVRTWLDTVLDLPWGKVSSDQLDVAQAREVLDADHHGLADVKDRISEYLAVRQLRHQRGLDASPAGSGGHQPSPAGSGGHQPSPAGSRRGSGAILTLVGPPGVGKTSLGASVARALGRSFVRVSLGGVRDEAEIRGHRRTYVGAMPGRIVRAIREAGTMNPVVMLDEVDKLGADWRGEPSSALLEVLDPAHNHAFVDHYLELDLDLSDVLFIATANVVDTIPGPLLDRMEVIRLDGYTEDEKVAIAGRHLLPRQIEAAGLGLAEVELPEATVRAIAADYTAEAGVRNLERALARILRKVALTVASRPTAQPGPVRIEEGDLHAYLGRPRHRDDVSLRSGRPGVATGLAVTSAGGDVLAVEALAIPAGSGSAGAAKDLVLTG